MKNILLILALSVTLVACGNSELHKARPDTGRGEPLKPGSAKVNENAFHVMLLSRTSHMRLNISS